MDEFVGAERKLSLADKLLVHLFAAANVDFTRGCVQYDFLVAADKILCFLLTDHDLAPLAFLEIILKRPLFGSIFCLFPEDSGRNIVRCLRP